MKNVKFLSVAAIIAVIFTSCEKSDVEAKATEIQTTDVLVMLDNAPDDNGGELAGMVDTERPAGVLDWIDMIDIEADHVGTIGAPYSVSETFKMTDDGSGAPVIVLEDVALGENDFSAKGWSYNQTGASEYAWIAGEANDPWSWVEAQRLRVPNTNFVGTDDGVMIYENPTASQNIVNFDMEAESGRLIVAIRLSEEIRNGMYGSNYVVVRYRVSGGGWSSAQYFNPNHKDDLLTFYFSDNDLSVDGECVEFKFDVCDVNPVATNTFYEEICIENGKSIGCIYEIDYESVITDINNFNFNFDWQEVDCLDCPDSDYISTPAEPVSLWEDIIGGVMCGMNPGSAVDATDLYWGDVNDGGFARSAMTTTEFGGTTTSDVFQLKNGSNELVVMIVTTNMGSYSVPVPANSWYLVKGKENETITLVEGKTNNGQTTVWTKNGTSTLGTEFCF